MICYVTLKFRYLGSEAYTIIANYQKTQAGFQFLSLSEGQHFDQSDWRKT